MNLVGIHFVNILYFLFRSTSHFIFLEIFSTLHYQLMFTLHFHITRWLIAEPRRRGDKQENAGPWLLWPGRLDWLCIELHSYLFLSANWTLVGLFNSLFWHSWLFLLPATSDPYFRHSYALLLPATTDTYLPAFQADLPTKALNFQLLIAS